MSMRPALVVLSSLHLSLSLAACADADGRSSDAYQLPTTTTSDGGGGEVGTESAIGHSSDDGAATSTSDATDTVGSSTDADPSTTTGGGDESTGAPQVEFDDVPWITTDVGYGVAYKDLGESAGGHAFIGYAGYPFPLDASQSWVRELWNARLRELGVRWVWAVQGPATVSYAGLEVGNTSIVARLVDQLGDDGKVIVAGHSSGSYVAHELIRQLNGGYDPGGVTADRVVYFDLDGGTSGLYDADVQRLHRAYFVSVRDTATGTSAPNRSAMQYLDGLWHAKGGYLELEGDGSGCNAGAAWCLHMVVINARPHDPNDSDVIDYYDFVDRPVVTQWLDDVIDDAGLGE